MTSRIMADRVLLSYVTRETQASAWHWHHKGMPLYSKERCLPPPTWGCSFSSPMGSLQPECSLPIPAQPQLCLPSPSFLGVSLTHPGSLLSKPQAEGS